MKEQMKGRLFRAYLRDLRQKRHMSCEDLAQLTGVRLNKPLKMH